MKKTWKYIYIVLLVSACNYSVPNSSSFISTDSASTPVPKSVPSESNAGITLGVLGANDEEPVSQSNGQVVLAHQESASVTVLNLAE